jgi:hypothetical protein
LRLERPPKYLQQANVAFLKKKVGDEQDAHRRDIFSLLLRDEGKRSFPAQKEVRLPRRK